MRWLVLGVMLSACVPQAPVATTSDQSATSAPAQFPTTSAVTSSSVTSTEPHVPSTAASSITTATQPLQRLVLRQVGPDLPFPLLVTSRPTEESAFVVTKDGRVWLMTDDDINPTPVLDIRDRVRNSGEQGLLGMALHPETDGLVYLHYTARNGDTVISEFQMTDSTIDPDSERILIRHAQPAANHNGGMISFDPDGYLYVGLGDGGGAGDAFGNGQDTSTILGSLLRLDPSGGDPYAIPADNPFRESGAPEIWAYGLRNPWRFWIDGPTGLLYIADVGQDAFEEINVIRLADARGANFGWPVTEGLHCFSPRSGCDTAGLVLPVMEISHNDSGTCSITGGVVYRGTAIPELHGHYLYSDYCGGWLRSLVWDESQVTAVYDWTKDVGVSGRVTSFGVDGDGEVYVTTTERVLRLEPVR